VWPTEQKSAKHHSHGPIPRLINSGASRVQLPAFGDAFRTMQKPSGSNDEDSLKPSVLMEMVIPDDEAPLHIHDPRSAKYGK
jgi:hypothetical protein